MTPFLMDGFYGYGTSTAMNCSFMNHCLSYVMANSIVVKPVRALRRIGLSDQYQRLKLRNLDLQHYTRGDLDAMPPGVPPQPAEHDARDQKDR